MPHLMMARCTRGLRVKGKGLLQELHDSEALIRCLLRLFIPPVFFKLEKNTMGTPHLQHRI
jgi:hypothetical protein